LPRLNVAPCEFVRLFMWVGVHTVCNYVRLR